MKAVLLHHLGVPCISKIKILEETLHFGNEYYYLNPDVLIREEPGCAVITPPNLYAAFIQIDIDLLNKLRQDVFEVAGMSEKILKLLLENHIVSTQPFNKQQKVRQFKVEVTGLPTQALLDVTSACNCDCLACYHAQDLDSFTPSLKDTLARISKLFELGIGLFEVTGGEPLIRTDLGSILSYIKDLGGHYYVVTNGEFLAEINNPLASLLRKGLGLAISLDGVGEVHDQIRRRRGLYDRVIYGMMRARELGIKFYLVSTIHQMNLELIPAMIEVATHFETTLHLRPAVYTGAAISNQLDSTEIRHFLKDYLVHPNVRNGLISTKKTIPEARWYGCGIRKRISVDVRGRLYPCVMDRNSSSNNILDFSQETMAECLETETKQYLLRHNICQACQLVKDGSFVCGGFCRFSRSYRKEINNE